MRTRGSAGWTGLTNSRDGLPSRLNVWCSEPEEAGRPCYS